jgi:hypothetical protein
MELRNSMRNFQKVEMKLCVAVGAAKFVSY